MTGAAALLAGDVRLKDADVIALQEIIVRREITAQGRSRAFINGSLATAGALRDLSARLVELHGQPQLGRDQPAGARLAVGDDAGGQGRANAGQGGERGRIGGVDVNARAGWERAGAGAGRRGG